MGLDDIEGVGETASTRKKVENVNFSKRAMRTLLWNNPHSVYMMLHQSRSTVDDMEKAKLAVKQEIDDLIENGLEGVAETEEELNNLKDARNIIMEDL